MQKLIFLLTLMMSTFGCTVGPNYRRPMADVPAAYRGAPSLKPPQPGENPQRQSSTASAQSFGDQKWWDVFQDPQLQELIRTALKQNYDLRIAATRILEAQAQLGITRPDQLPTIGVGAAAANERFPRQKPVDREFETSASSVGASFAWELSFWGKYRRATEVSRGNLLATEWARRAVTNTLVSNVAASYFELRSLDLQ